MTIQQAQQFLRHEFGSEIEEIEAYLCDLHNPQEYFAKFSDTFELSLDFREFIEERQ